MWLSLINQENKQIRILLSGVKIEFVNFKLSTSLYFNHNFWLKYWIEVKLIIGVRWKVNTKGNKNISKIS
jgi:hypothetical protein